VLRERREVMHLWSDEEIKQRLYGNYYGEDTSMSGYTAMVEDIKNRLGVGDDPDYGEREILEDVNNHGADTGWSGFTYTSETVEFFDEHEEAIMELAQQDADDMGYANVAEFVASFNRADMADTMGGYKNLMAWYALETVARQIVDGY
jgi:hypothetical protein